MLDDTVHGRIVRSRNIFLHIGQPIMRGRCHLSSSLVFNSCGASTWGAFTVAARRRSSFSVSSRATRWPIYSASARMPEGLVRSASTDRLRLPGENGQLRPQGIEGGLYHVTHARDRQDLVEELIDCGHGRGNQPGDEFALIRRQLPKNAVDLVDLRRRLLQFGKRRFG